MAHCKHCKSKYIPARKGHIFCSATCRKLEHKKRKKKVSDKKRARRIAEKLRKFAACAFGRYLLREIKRAGTVEVLQGHTVVSLKELATLRRKCTASGGYENGEPTGSYELSHIWPVAATERVGLLTSENLVITPKFFNRTHGQKFPVSGYMGKSIPRASLQDKWTVSDDMDAKKIMQLLRAYLGNEFDQWLSSFVVSLTQRNTLINQLQKAGLPRNQLQDKTLRELKGLAEEEDVPYFDVNKQPVDLKFILLSELNRLELEEPISKALELLCKEEMSLDDRVSVFRGTEAERLEFEEMLVAQALSCLHGQRYTTMWREKPLLDWLSTQLSSRDRRKEKENALDEDDYVL